MIASEVLREVASTAGLELEFKDLEGANQKIADSQLAKLLQAMGYNIGSEHALQLSVRKLQKKPVLAKVKIARQYSECLIELSVSATAQLADYHWQLTTEDGQVYQGVVADTLINTSDIAKQDQTAAIQFSLPDNLPLGYHCLQLKGKTWKTPLYMSLIIVPEGCFKPQALIQGDKLWGVSVQLYGLKSQTNWGIGDFSDLSNLMDHIANAGGSFVGINPLHSLFLTHPENASPYSPSSRYWLNPLYIDVTKVTEFNSSQTAQALFKTDKFQQELQAVRNTDWVDYLQVAKLKISMLEQLFDTFVTQELAVSTPRAKLFQDFVKSGAESLLKQASFDALMAHFNLKSPCYSWQQFPQGYRDFSHKRVKAFIEKYPQKVEFYAYLQWLAAMQLTEVQQLAISKNMPIGLYRDLAIGVTDTGVESWGADNSLATHASIGAPPDNLAPQGQNWGLLPFMPQQLTAHAYQPFIELLRSNMAHCGALRIDHILGLMRLWWIPKGDTAGQGAYLDYPIDDLLGLVALESQRNQCVIIGEDLGTVPEGLIEKLQAAGVYSYKVYLFETAPDGGYYSPAHYPHQSLTTLCTHDMPTLTGYWHGDDLTQGEALGIYSDKQQLTGLVAERSAKKLNIVESVNWHGFLPEGIGQDQQNTAMNPQLSKALQLHLAAGSSELLSLQLEDWLNMELPVNVPGTVDEYPNWRRKLSRNLDEIFNDVDIQALTCALTATRKG